MGLRVTSLVLVVGAALLSPAEARPAPVQETGQETGLAAVPELRVTRMVDGLSIPWDVAPVGRGDFLITERATRRLLRWRGGRLQRVRYPRNLVWESGETGLMSVVADPEFRRNRRFYMCHGGHRPDGAHDVRVVAYRLLRDKNRARMLEVLRGGIDATSGRHGGCRLLITRRGALLVGTGDAAVGTNPRNRRSLAGKVLRLDPRTGRAWPRNPWIDARNRRKRFLFTYGHRNVQGLAQRRNGTLWSVEHGPDRDDEVNLLRRAGDYGWHPVPADSGDSEYNEKVPMTDHALPGRQRAARWRSGDPTIATSGATFVYGDRWGALSGSLAVAALKGSRLVFMRFDRDGVLRHTRAPEALQQFGRLRSVTRAPNGDLLVTTSNGSDDAVLRVSPVG